MEKKILTDISSLNTLIVKEGIAEYIRDYYAAVNGYLKVLYEKDDFYIAEDTTYQPWLSIMGTIPDDITEQELYDMLTPYIEDDKYIAVYTNVETVSEFLNKFTILTYHEDFWVAVIPKVSDINDKGIRLATINDLPYIEKTYHRSGYKQLQNRINCNQMWVMADGNGIKGYAGIHKDCSLGFEYVAPAFRRQNVASRMQLFIAKQMLADGMLPYVMVSVGNDVARNFQTKFGSEFASKIFYFYAKGPYELE